MFRVFVRNYTSNIKYYEGISKVNNYRENRSYGKSTRVKSIKKFYELTREIPEHNIDSHDNSLYVKEPPNLYPYKNFCFYPGILGYLGQENFDNTTVIIAENDNWCTFNNTFVNTWIAKDCYHGFMIPNKDRDIPVAKYNFPTAMTHKQYLKLIPNHNYLTSVYGHTEETIRLKSNEKYSIMYLNKILESL